MKNRTKIVFIISVLMILLVIAACDVLVAPIKGRSNPFDTGNPVPAAANFSAELLYNEGSFIGLSWNDGETSESNKTEGYLIIRKASEAPESIYDGEVVGRVDYGNQTYNDYIDGNDDYPRGCRVYYSIFSFGGKWDDMNEDERLFIDYKDGGGAEIGNAENYDFTGPVSASVVVTDTVTLEASSAGSIFNPSGAQADPLEIYVDNTYITQIISFINFDLKTAGVSNSVVTDAVLYLKTNDNSVHPTGTGSMHIQVMNREWEQQTWDYVSVSDAVYEDDIEISPPDTSQTDFNQDITDIVKVWASGEIINYGLRLYSESATMPYYRQFYSIGNGDNSPKLTVTYYKE